jgi:mono/diheme cytochrome c family protein
MALQAATVSPGEPATSNALVQVLHDPGSDLDGDDLSASDELDLGTDPLLADTDGGGLDDGAEAAAGLDPLDPADDAPRVTYTADIQPLLASRCNSCHGGGAASGGRNFDTYEELFQASADVPSIELIRPFDVGASYLRHKVRGTQATVGGSGSRMPLGGPFLTEPQLLLIEDWINLGAPR